MSTPSSRMPPPRRPRSGAGGTSVVFPAPEGPTTATTSPGAIGSDSSWTARGVVVQVEGDVVELTSPRTGVGRALGRRVGDRRSGLEQLEDPLGRAHGFLVRREEGRQRAEGGGDAHGVEEEGDHLAGGQVAGEHQPPTHPEHRRHRREGGEGDHSEEGGAHPGAERGRHHPPITRQSAPARTAPAQSPAPPGSGRTPPRRAQSRRPAVLHRGGDSLEPLAEDQRRDRHSARRRGRSASGAAASR